jgi:hypothetical protein
LITTAPATANAAIFPVTSALSNTLTSSVSFANSSCELPPPEINPLFPKLSIIEIPFLKIMLYKK